MTSESATTDLQKRTLRRAHSWLGALLGAYVCLHLWVELSALDGREAWLARTQAYGLGVGLGALFIVAMLVHGALGLRSFLATRRSVQAGGAPAHPWLAVQLVTGLLVAGFAVLHLAPLWPPDQGPHASVAAGYDMLWEHLGRLPVLLPYLVGVAALALHVALGAARALERLVGAEAGDASPDPSARRRGVRYAAFVLGLLLWLGYVQVVGCFAIGEALIPTSLWSGLGEPEDDGRGLRH